MFTISLTLLVFSRMFASNLIYNKMKKLTTSFYLKGDKLRNGESAIYIKNAVEKTAFFAALK